MKRNKYFAAAICLLSFAQVGCHKPPKPVFTVPPNLQAGYVVGGDTIQWTPTGKPFEIFWNGLNPCTKNDSLKSDGRTVVTCHVFRGGKYGGTYIYDVDVPSKEGAKEYKERNPGHTGVFVMHVGSCNNCSVASPPLGLGDQELSASAGNGNEVRISCPGNGAATVVVPPNGPSGLTVGDEVVFEYIGANPSDGSPAMTITFQTNDCENLPSPNTFYGESGFCKIKFPGTVTYNVVTSPAFGCSSTSATLKAAPSTTP